MSYTTVKIDGVDTLCVAVPVDADDERAEIDRRIASLDADISNWQDERAELVAKRAALDNAAPAAIEPIESEPK